MTLTQWANAYGKVIHTHPTSGGKWTPDFYDSSPDQSRTVGRSDLWRLDDYIVSSVCGGSIWFIPRLEDK
jgi:hypothetical protein